MDGPWWSPLLALAALFGVLIGAARFGRRRARGPDAGRDAIEDAGLPRYGSRVSYGGGYAGWFRAMFKAPPRLRSPGTITELNATSIEIDGPDPDGAMRLRSFEITGSTPVPKGLAVGEFVIVEHDGARAVRIRRD